jgi:hypothetical protein
MKNRCPSEQNTKVVRINCGDYALLAEITRRAGVTMAEALHMALERQEVETRVSPAQIPMPAFRVSPLPQSVIAVNGNKHSAFRVKPRGGVIRE